MGSPKSTKLLAEPTAERNEPKLTRNRKSAHCSKIGPGN
jgi:hypothetical protein